MKIQININSVFYIFIKLLEVEQNYKEKPDYQDSIVEIYNTLAADALINNRSNPEDNANDSQKIVQIYNKKADDVNPSNEYTNLIRAFYELKHGNNDIINQ